jgi:uncharacterized coiled-coil DUF342 family protein
MLLKGEAMTEITKKELSLNFVWGIRLSLRAESDKLRAESDKLRAESDKLWAESDKLRAESDKLWAEGDKLRAEGDKLWAEAILSVYGNIEMEWKNWSEEKQSHECHLETGEVFYPL